jgi:hypothetical protein
LERDNKILKRLLIVSMLTVFVTLGAAPRVNKTVPNAGVA